MRLRENDTSKSVRDDKKTITKEIINNKKDISETPLVSNVKRLPEVTASNRIMHASRLCENDTSRFRANLPKKLRENDIISAESTDDDDKHTQDEDLETDEDDTRVCYIAKSLRLRIYCLTQILLH